MVDISLIPKDYKEAQSGIGTIFSKIGIFIITLIIISVLVYGGLIIYSKSLDNQFIDVQNEINELETQRDDKFENQAKLLDKILRNLRIILKDHLYWSGLFSKIENLIVPQVSLSNFSSLIEQDDSVVLTLNGKTSGYTYLAKQVISFSKDELVSDVQVSGITLGTDGGIEFGLEIKFLKDILLQN